MVDNRHDSSPFDDLASAYDVWFDEEGKLIFATEVRAFQELLAQLPKPWLEVGVGSGRFAQALGIETGIDPAAKLLEIARKRGITVFQVKGEEEFFAPETFGTVFLIVTLCFVDSPPVVLKEIHRLLKPEGKIVLGLVLRESSWGQFYLMKKKKRHRFYRHATFYSYHEVVALLERAGFIMERIVSTLFQKPSEVKEIELPKEGFSPEAGFTIIVSKKALKEAKAASSEQKE